MELLQYNLGWILGCFLCKINGEYYAGKFNYATPIHPEIFFKPVPWNPSGYQLRTSYGWEGIWQIID
jgi:hypothetical protein